MRMGDVRQFRKYVDKIESGIDSEQLRLELSQG
jgi:hypothetical protein